MLVYFGVLLFSLSISFLNYNRYLNYKTALKIIFGLITIYGSIRYSYGSDYFSYYDLYNRLNNDGYISRVIEPGYVLLNKILPSFYLVVAITSFLVTFSYYYFFKKYVIPKYLPYALSILFLSVPSLIGQFSGIRNAIAINIFMFAWIFIVERKMFKFLIMIFLASLFHKSAFIMIPVYFLANPSEFSKNKVMPMFYGSVFYYFINGFFISEISIYLTNTFFPEYSLYNDNYQINILSDAYSWKEFLVAISRFVAFYILLRVLSENNNKYQIVILKIMMLYFFVSFTNPVALSGRLFFYFAPFFIAGSTIILNNVREKVLKDIFKVYLYVTLIYFFYKWTLGSTFVNYIEYKTIFEAGVF